MKQLLDDETSEIRAQDANLYDQSQFEDSDLEALLGCNVEKITNILRRESFIETMRRASQGEESNYYSEYDVNLQDIDDINRAMALNEELSDDDKLKKY